MPDLPGGTLTVLHTDIENSTPLTLFHGERYPAVLARHRELLREALNANGGYKELVTGSGISFTDRGTHTLKEIPGEWRLFAPEDLS